MPVLVLDHRDLEAYLPHRGANLLLDDLTIAADGQSSRSTTRVEVGDPRGRDLFARRSADGTVVWLEPFLGEVMALTGVVLLKERLDAAGHVAVFSAVSRAEFLRPVPLGAEIVGEALIVRDRGSFTQFQAVMRQQGEVVYTADIMSGSATMAEVAGGDVRPPFWDALEPLQADFSFKDRPMRFVDGVCRVDAGTGTLVAAYRYNEDHPLVPGHFPGAPLLMGMAQWTAIADAAWEARARFGITGGVRADGRILRADGSEVLGVRGLELADAAGVPVLRRTKRVAFREPILPGDGVQIEVTVTPV